MICLLNSFCFYQRLKEVASRLYYGLDKKQLTAAFFRCFAYTKGFLSISARIMTPLRTLWADTHPKHLANGHLHLIMIFTIIEKIVEGERKVF